MSMTFDDRIAPPPRRAAPRRAAAARPGKGPARAAVAWIRRRFRARPAATVAHALFAAAALAAVLNAVAWQSGAPERAPAAEIAGPPAPPARPADLGAPRQAQAPAAQTPAATLQAVPAPARAASASRDGAAREGQPRESAGRDAIGELIRTGMVPGMEAPRPPAPVVERASAGAGQDRSAQDRTIAAAQRALNKLGFGPVREDGRFGDGTRAAIERFERERRIPVTRDLSPRTQRELAAASGMRME